MPLVSCYILTYNQSYDDIEIPIKSVCEQNYARIELIISDDGSKEFSKEIVEKIVKKYDKRFESVIININPQNLGTVKHVNCVHELMKGDIICGLGGGDSFYSENTVGEIVDYFLNSENLLVYSKRKILLPSGNSQIEPSKRVVKLITQKHNDLLNCICRRGNLISGMGMYYKRELFQLIGKYDERFRLLEDYPFFVKLCFENIRFGYMDELTVKYALGGVSTGKKINPVLAEDFKKVTNELIYPNRYRLSKWTQRVVCFKYKKNKCKGKIDYMGILIRYPDVVAYRLYVEISQRLKKRIRYN